MANEIKTTLQKQGLIDNSGAGGTAAKEARAEASYQQWLKWVAESEANDDLALRKSILWATKSIASRKHGVWIMALSAKNEMIKAAIKEKAILPDNYWKAEHLAWLEYDVAYKLVAIAEAELGGK